MTAPLNIAPLSERIFKLDIIIICLNIVFRQHRLKA